MLQAGSEQLAVLMRSCARYHLKYGEAKTAAKLLEQLRKYVSLNFGVCYSLYFMLVFATVNSERLCWACRKNPRDHKVLAQLIAAYSKFDAQKAQLYPCLTCPHVCVL